MSARVVHPSKPEFISAGTQNLAEDLAGVLTKVVADQVPARIYPGDLRDSIRSADFAPEPIAYLIPASHYAAFRAFVAAREAFLKLAD